MKKAVLVSFALMGLVAPRLAGALPMDEPYRIEAGWSWGWLFLVALVVCVIVAIALGRRDARRSR